jgi:predicted O-linked N-acetylglucosamine transferase (SPINDLY family)
VVCYDNQDRQVDSYTLRLRAHADHWVRTVHLDDDALAERIRADRIDILVDLSGHTGGNRLPVFAMKPAPVTATWFGYMNTTGLSTMDYRISDAGLCPPGCERFYSEAIIRLPSAAAWSPAPDAPEPGPPPFARNGHIRFGSFNNWTKVSDHVLAVWARLLDRVPNARLVLIAGGGDTEAGRAAVLDRCAACGIDRWRVEVHGTRPLEGFLDLVASVDIALDPFPYNGGTTSLHTLWMGVPIVSMVASSEVGRVSGGLLAGVGLAKLCARDPKTYVERALALAMQRDRLAALRAQLRERMRDGSSMKGVEITANLEKAYKTMWHNRLKV